MEDFPVQTGDSQRQQSGSIPGSADLPAFTLTSAPASAVPVLIAVPHAGRAYSEALLDNLRNPGPAALKLEDRYVDRLGEAVARETGAALLVAHAPRAMIDLNRAPDEVDWDMFAQGRPPGAANGSPGIRVRSGLGLIPRRLPGMGELWKRRLELADLTARLSQVHEPYHAALGSALAALRQRWGAALLIDLHSMPPLGTRGGRASPAFVVGDRFGASCNGLLAARCFSLFALHCHAAAHNQPYAGGYVLQRHADPARGLHALQLEVDRSCYLDERLIEPGTGLDAMVAVLSGLVRQLAVDVAELGGDGLTGSWPQAAE